ncbi:unnamed protein product, partial [Urochloa humidicola]
AAAPKQKEKAKVPASSPSISDDSCGGKPYPPSRPLRPLHPTSSPPEGATGSPVDPRHGGGGELSGDFVRWRADLGGPPRAAAGDARRRVRPHGHNGASLGVVRRGEVGHGGQRQCGRERRLAARGGARWMQAVSRGRRGVCVAVRGGRGRHRGEPAALAASWSGAALRHVSRCYSPAISTHAIPWAIQPLVCFLTRAFAPPASRSPPATLPRTAAPISDPSARRFDAGECSTSRIPPPPSHSPQPLPLSNTARGASSYLSPARSASWMGGN